jgi:hypothetical protein
MAGPGSIRAWVLSRVTKSWNGAAIACAPIRKWPIELIRTLDS